MSIDKIAIESDFEREALDMIDTASKRVESLAKGDAVDWDGEGLPPVGVECEFKESSPRGLSTFSDWSKCSILAYNKPKESSDELQIIIRDDRGDSAIIYSCDDPEFRKPESPEQKAERQEFIDAAIHELKSGMSDTDYAKALFDSGKFKLVD